MGKGGMRLGGKKKTLMVRQRIGDKGREDLGGKGKECPFLNAHKN